MGLHQHTRYRATLKVFLQQLIKGNPYGSYRKEKETAETLKTLFRFHNGAEVSAILRTLIPCPKVGELIYGQGEEPQARCYRVPGDENRIQKLYFLQGKYIGAQRFGVISEIEDIQHSDVSQEEKLEILQKLRRYYPCDELRLSELCGADHEPEIPEAGTEELAALAERFFDPAEAPLTGGSGNLPEDRLEAMRRLHIFLRSLNIYSAFSFTKENCFVRVNELEYKHAVHGEHCYDGGCCDYIDIFCYIRLKLHPSEAWEDYMLQYGVHEAQSKKEKYRYILTKRSLDQGDCDCLINLEGHLVLRNPFGLNGILEIWQSES